MDSLSCVSVTLQSVPISLLLFFVATTLLGLGVFVYVAVSILAPVPRPALKAEKQFIQVETDGRTSDPKPLPCWLDRWAAEKQTRQKGGDPAQSDLEIEAPEIYLSLIIPAYNEEERLGSMLKEAVEYLAREFPHSGKPAAKKGHTNGSAVKPGAKPKPTGWEVLLVSDGSTDKTVQKALDYARSLTPSESAQSIRLVQLEHNRGKGGAVTHGLRHARGAYALFADADGATTFGDLAKLLPACEQAAAADTTGCGRAVAVGSRAHLVGSAAVVQRSFLRNLLMHSFHIFIRLLTPPATGRVRDTQCGFKLFTRSALPYIVPYMHMEGWIFDVEMLMLAESAGINVVEVPVGWREVLGSKLNVVWDSLGMAWGLAILRVAWGLGIYKRW